MGKKQQATAPGEQARCHACEFFAALETPYHCQKEGYPEGITVYGFCAKNYVQRFVFYPVYLPDGGVCIAYKKKKEIK